jgi:hypothetical protein
MKDPNTVAAEWAARLGASTQKITDGINAVQVAPGQKAAAQKVVWAQNTANSRDKWAANTAKVPLQDWKDAAINKGVQRIGQGATAAVGKQAAFYAKLLPYVDQQRAALPARGDLNANINRMTQFVMWMSKFNK